MIVSAYNVLQIDVAMCLTLFSVRSFSSVEMLDGFNVRIARYSKTNVVFFKKFLRDKFFTLVNCKYTGTRPSFFADI